MSKNWDTNKPHNKNSVCVKVIMKAHRYIVETMNLELCYQAWWQMFKKIFLYCGAMDKFESKLCQVEIEDFYQ